MVKTQILRYAQNDHAYPHHDKRIQSTFVKIKLVILSVAKDLVFKILRCAQNDRFVCIHSNDRLNDKVFYFVVFIAMTAPEILFLGIYVIPNEVKNLASSLTFRMTLT